MTLQELRDELDRTRPAWDELADLDDVPKDGELPALSEAARRHELVLNELLRRQRSRGECTHRRYPQSRGESVLRLPDPRGGHRLETGIRAADSQQERPGGAGPAG